MRLRLWGGERVQGRAGVGGWPEMSWGGGSIKGNPRLCFCPIFPKMEIACLWESLGPWEALVSIGRAGRNSKKVTWGRTLYTIHGEVGPGLAVHGARACG